MRPANWTTPNRFANLEFKQVRNPESKIDKASAGLEPATSGLEDLCSDSVELRSQMERARGLEPPTYSFVMNCADSVAPRPRGFHFQFSICDLLLVSSHANSSQKRSQIENIWSERRGSNPQHPVWKTGTQPFEFRSQNWCTGEDSNFRSTERAFTD